MSDPLVSISLPVFNGERYVEAAIDGVLNQTYRNLELIVTDNASTDSTPAILERKAAADDRVRIHRNETNLGAAPNFNLGFELARGPLFKWVAHDDVCAPTFVERCVRALQDDPDVVLAFPEEIDIDENGDEVGERPYPLDTSPAPPRVRLRRILAPRRGSPPVFGVIRREILAQTGLIGSYDESDQVLLVELILRGRFAKIDAFLQYHREHPERSVRVHRTRESAAVWFDSRLRGKRLRPETRLLSQYLRAVRNAPLGPADRIGCTLDLLRIARWRGTFPKIARELLHLPARP